MIMAQLMHSGSACERMNGILGSVSTNYHAIEAQLRKKFLFSQIALQSMASSDCEEVNKMLSPFQY